VKCEEAREAEEDEGKTEPDFKYDTNAWKYS
jgi:hypothetical protein